jgi:hypothetical protein
MRLLQSECRRHLIIRRILVCREHAVVSVVGVRGVACGILVESFAVVMGNAYGEGNAYVGSSTGRGRKRGFPTRCLTLHKLVVWLSCAGDCRACYQYERGIGGRLGISTSCGGILDHRDCDTCRPVFHHIVWTCSWAGGLLRSSMVLHTERCDGGTACCSTLARPQGSHCI